MNYKDLDIWKLSKELVIDIHFMSLSLPKFEQFEEAQQIRRSMKSVKSNIVEGYGRRRYKAEFIRFLIIAHASCDETLDHLETLQETASLNDLNKFTDLKIKLDKLGRKINCFITAVEEKHNTS